MTSRRTILLSALGTPLFASFSRLIAAQPLTCGKQTLPQVEGPFYTPNSPQRSVLVEKVGDGARFILLGSVLSAQCKPVPNALVDLWHADEKGDYDNSGFRYRGHVRSNAEGRYRFETIVPGVYPGRTRHFHVKVQAPGRRILTTQLYFPNEPGNRRDGLYRSDLDVQLRGEREGTFDFVVDA